MDCKNNTTISNDEKEEIIQMFRPLIKKSLSNVPYQEREDLEQELQLKLLYKLDWLYKQPTPGFWEFAIDHQSKNCAE